MQTGVYVVALKNFPVLVKLNIYLSISSNFILPL